jgi:hypothetical protein
LGSAGAHRCAPLALQIGVGEFVITVPHLGAVALETGRVIEAVDGTDLFRGGPQDFLDYYANGDTSAVEKLCGALGAT